MTATDDFGRLRHAIAACDAARRKAEAAWRAYKDVRPSDWRLRAATQEASAAQQKARAEVLKLYALDLMAPILGGEWQQARRGSPVWQFHRRDCGAAAASFTHPLVDHRVAFRRKGTRGPLTWKNSMLVSEPYDATDRKGALRDEALAQARHLRAEFGLGTWLRRDLSGWFPGWTALVLIARDLEPADAARFGFAALA